MHTTSLPLKRDLSWQFCEEILNSESHVSISAQSNPPLAWDGHLLISFILFAMSPLRVTTGPGVCENETVTQATKTFYTSLVQSQFCGSFPYYNIWQHRKGFSKIQAECSCSSIPSNLLRIFHVAVSYYISLPTIAICSSILLMADLNSLSSSFRRPFNNVKASMRNIIIQTS